VEVKIFIDELRIRLRHSTIEYTVQWCFDNGIEIHVEESSGQKFIFSFQFESAITRIKILSLIKTYPETWEQKWKIYMREYMRRNMDLIGLIILN
jgi:hypothetical protein